MTTIALKILGATAIIGGQVSSFAVLPESYEMKSRVKSMKPLHASFIENRFFMRHNSDIATPPHSNDLDGSDYASAPLVDNRYSASDWLYNVFSLPKSSVLREIKNPVLTITIWSFLVTIIQKLCSRSTVRLFKYLGKHMCIPGTAHGFLVSSLGLLLVFRTNSAYQKFNEGRKIWEEILSISRNMSRMISLYENEVGSMRRRRILNLVASFPYLLRNHIRPGCFCAANNGKDIPAECSFILKDQSIEMLETRHEGDKQALGGTTQPPSYHEARKRECWVDKRTIPWSLCENEQNLKQLARSENRPLWVCDRMSREIMDVSYGDNYTSRERLQLLGQIDKLTNAVGQCERIHQTAVPLNYARHSLRSLSLWLLTLPFTLVNSLGFLSVPVMAATSWLLFGVYQIGYSIEDPFQGSIRLSMLCDVIRRDVLGESGERESAFCSSRHNADKVKNSKFGLDPYDVIDKNKVEFDELFTNTKPKIEISFEQ
eukprot:CAMPEP_0194178994 /NCGR_PEP_ID=MMETSP0154-20130528/12518_1 /TAXON_ID=1049557 /ORGANISM="Thalassiothrix antarctica, Strain L6-D1" /LENGTH=486 /DNA_ID=CAMNT_0038894175 /DNA_START=115 /DNA_END=1575 /DNA_ORIENTATION=+